MFMKIKSNIQMNIFKRNLILPVIVISIAIIFLYNPFLNIDVKSFDRELGNGILYGTDINKRINNIEFFDFFLVPGTFFIVYLVISVLCRNITEKSKECIDFINIVSAISIGAMILAYINRFSSNDFTGAEIVLPCCLILFGILFLSVNHNKFKLDFNVFKWCIFATLPIVLCVGVLCNKIGVAMSLNRFSFVYFVLFILLFLLVTIFKEYIDFSLIKKAYIPFIIAPGIVSMFLELTNILNQYSIFWNSKHRSTFIIYILAIVLFVGYYFFLKFRQNSLKNFNFEKYYYPILLIDFALISVQPSLQNTFNTGFFEQSNSGTAISELFNHGKLPIIETFDAHMLSNEVGNIIYGLLNNDPKGSIFMGYSLLPVFVLIYYFLFTKFFNRDAAFFIIFLYPIVSDNTFQIFPLMPIVILSFLYAYKSKTYKGYLLYWISIAITCIFKLDMGFALALSSVSVWCIVFFMKKNEVSIKKLILTCSYIVSIAILLFICICMLKKISPLERGIEFLNLCESNINWAKNSIGDQSMVAFMVSYFIMPSITSILIILVILKKYKHTNFISDDKFIIVLIVGFLCIFNLSRGLVRHSLAEGTNSYIISSSLLFTSMIIYIFSKKNNLFNFIVSNIVLVIVINLTLGMNSIFPRPLLNSAVSEYLTFDSYNIVATQKKERVTVSEKMKGVYIPIKYALDKTLLPDETYIDFTNQTLLYALTEREKPMYVNQSPGLLCDEYTQQKFIEQCEQNSEKVPFVLMPIENMQLSTDLDEIKNSYRYYLISEYIGKNFRPLFRNSKFAVWCRKDKFDEKFNLVSQLIEDNKEAYSKLFLSEESKNILKVRNEKLDVANNQLILTSTAIDPNLTGLDELIKSKGLSSDCRYISISIKYESDKDGNFELFYTTNKDENYSQQKVISKNMPKNGVFEAIIPYTNDTKIRFDTPDNSIVKINDISFRELEDQYEDDIAYIDYNYGPIDYHSYDLMNIPYIWANYDKMNINEKKEQMKITEKSSVYDLSHIDKNSGNYLLVNASSDKDGKMTVQLGKEDGSGFVVLSQFNFSLNKGNKLNYLVRLSSDFMWYSGEVNAIKIISDNNSIIEGTSILKGDTLK